MVYYIPSFSNLSFLEDTMNIVKIVRKIFVVLFAFLLFACASVQRVYDPQTGQYKQAVSVDTVTPTAVGINTAGGAAIGCGAGALLGAVVGDPAGGCALGAVAGGYTGAVSTREETFVPNQQQQGYAPRLATSSPCTTEYNQALQQINNTAALRQREAANYRATGDQNGAARIEQSINAWHTSSVESIRVQYQNCITQMTPEQQYTQEQYAPQQQVPAYSSRPVFPPVQLYSPYYNYPYYNNYYGYPYYQPYYGYGPRSWGYYGGHHHHHRRW
jgi:hypothetical protein